MPAWKVVTTLSLPGKRPVGQVAISPDGASIVAEGEKELELWSLAGEAPRKVAGIGPRYNFGEGLAISPKGDVVATGGMFDILVHDLRTGKLCDRWSTLPTRWASSSAPTAPGSPRRRGGT